MAEKITGVHFFVALMWYEKLMAYFEKMDIKKSDRSFHMEITMQHFVQTKRLTV